MMKFAYIMEKQSSHVPNHQVNAQGAHQQQTFHGLLNIFQGLLNRLPMAGRWSALTSVAN